MKAWHFVEDKLRDGQPIQPIPPDGVWLVHEGELELCKSGYHASVKLIDALLYAPGNTICRVEIGGKIIEDDDRLVAEKRKILWRIDGERVLRAFARWCALQVVDKWDAPDVVVKWLTTGDEDIRDAALNAALNAARNIARNAAWSTARNAAWSAAWSAARDIAWFVAWSAAWDAARSAQNKQLELMAREAREGKTEWVFEAKVLEQGNASI